jgi:chromosome segregation ATPase
MQGITIEALIGILTIAASVIGTLIISRTQGKKNSADAVTASIEAATKLVTVQQQRITQLHQDIKAASEENADYATRLKAATDRINLAEEQLQEVREHLQKARDMIALLTCDLDNMKRENIELRARVVDLEAQRIKWVEERERMKCEIDKLAERLKGYEKAQG